ncbi:MAG: 50S ribosomal protein L10 [Clostridia bacterium]|nr:50S ribosomal protein L10 [Clostridia bacterium]
MPNAKVLEAKKAQVTELKERIAASKAAVVVSYKGISVAEDTALRKQLREAGVHYEVVKNTILGRAADELELGELKNVLEGTTALATCAEDELIAEKLLYDYAEKSTKGFEIKAGIFENKVIDADTVKNLAKVPPKDVLLGMLAGGLNSIVAGLARAINAVAEKGGEAAPAAEAEA